MSDISKISGKKFIAALAAIFLLAGLFFGMQPGAIPSLLAEEDEPAGRIAFVDVEMVFENHPEKERAEEELNMTAEEMQARLEDEAEDLEAGEQEELIQEYQKELEREEEELIGEVLNDIEETITGLAEEKGVEIVLEGKHVLYGGYDLTDEVLEQVGAD